MNRLQTLRLNQIVINDRAICALIGVMFFILAMSLGAYIRIPLKGSPVPITLQTFFVMLSGSMMGKRLGLFSQLSYILLGCMGLPVFQGYASGILYIFGPTGGYLAGFVLASYFIGRMGNMRNFSRSRIVVSFVIGDLIIHLLGAFWLAYSCRMTVINALSIGVLPFIPGEVVKISFAALICFKLSQRSRNFFPIN